MLQGNLAFTLCKPYLLNLVKINTLFFHKVNKTSSLFLRVIVIFLVFYLRWSLKCIFSPSAAFHDVIISHPIRVYCTSFWRLIRMLLSTGFLLATEPCFRSSLVRVSLLCEILLYTSDPDLFFLGYHCSRFLIPFPRDALNVGSSPPSLSLAILECCASPARQPPSWYTWQPPVLFISNAYKGCVVDLGPSEIRELCVKTGKPWLSMSVLCN